MKFVGITILFLLIPFSTATALEIENQKKVAEAELIYFARGTIRVDGNVKDLKLEIRALPQNGVCKFNRGKITTDELGNKVLKQSYNSVEEKIEWWVNCTVHNKGVPHSFVSLEPFPTANNYTPSLQQFLEETSLVEVNDEIRTKSNEIVSGSDSLLEASIRLAEWVKNNMEYDVSYMGRMQKSSLIIKNLEGVCAEYAHLLLSFLRSLNIPSRYVAGYTYSGSLRFSNTTFQPHAWVEAYINNEWIPLDPTLGEFARLDALHIRLFHSLDGSQPLVKVKYSGSAHITIEEPQVDVRIISLKEEKKEFGIKARWNKDAVGSDDYVLLTVDITNPKGTYEATTLFLTKPRDVKLVYGKVLNAIVLSPRSTTSLYFIFHTPSLQKGYIYTFPIKLSLLWGEDVKIELRGDVGISDKSSLEELLFRVKQKEIQAKYGIEIKRVEIPKVVYETNPSINISLKNVGNSMIESLILKVEYDSTSTKSVIGRLFIGEEKNLTLTLKKPKRFGTINMKIQLIYGGKTDYLSKNFVFAKKPEVNIRYEGPTTIMNFEPLVFNLTVDLSKPVNYTLITISTPRYKTTIPQPKLTNFILNWKNLRIGRNIIKVSVHVKDEYDTWFSSEREVTIERRASNPILFLVMKLVDVLTSF